MYKIKKYELYIKKLNVVDLLESDYLIPFQIFNKKKQSLGIWGKIQEKNNTDEKEIDKEKVLPILENLFNICIKNKGFNFKNFYVENGFDGCMEVFALIFDISIQYFRKFEYKITEDKALYIDQMAKRYAKTPIEILCFDKSKYNDLDALIFNNFVCDIAINNENKQNKRKMQRLKNGR